MNRYIQLYEVKNYTTNLSSALKSFDAHNKLNPEFWLPTGHLIPKIRADLIQIGEDFYSSLQIDTPMVDLQFTGSLANFSYSKYSDIDLHVLVSYIDVDTNQILVENYFMAKKNLWNLKHDIEIKNYPVEIYVQDSEGTAVSSGVYSVLQDAWLKEPTSKKLTYDSEEVKMKVKSLASEIDNAILQNSIELSDKFWTKLKRIRSEGLLASGEYSSSNLAFKALRRSGYLDKLSKFEDSYYDKLHSIN